MRLAVRPHLRRAEISHKHLLLRQLRLVLADEVGVVEAAGRRDRVRVLLNAACCCRSLVLPLPVVFVPEPLNRMVLLILDGYNAFDLLHRTSIKAQCPISLSIIMC